MDETFIPPQLPTVDPKDVNQEAELLKLRGITPNKRIIANRLRSHELIYFQAPETAIPLGALTQNPTPPAEVQDRLLDWSLDQPEEVQHLLWNFLEDPELNFEATLHKLAQMELLKAPLNTPTSSVSIASIIRKNLPATAAQLADLIRQLSPTTERPEATVRQFVRRNLRAGNIEVVDEQIIWKG